MEHLWCPPQSCRGDAHGRTTRTTRTSRTPGGCTVVSPWHPHEAWHKTGPLHGPHGPLPAPGLILGTKPPGMKQVCCRKTICCPKNHTGKTTRNSILSSYSIKSYHILSSSIIYLTCSLFTSDIFDLAHAFVRASAQRQRLWPHVLWLLPALLSGPAMTPWTPWTLPRSGRLEHRVLGEI